MGVSVGFSDAPGTPPNPNPHRFTIVKAEEWGEWLIAEIHYPDATTFGGRKLLVFRGLSEADLRSRDAIDPHFFDRLAAPIARFRPDAEGWSLARGLVTD